MSDVLLVLNAGSSSIKFALYEAHTEPTADHLICEGGIGSLGHRPHFKVVNSDGQAWPVQCQPEAPAVMPKASM